MNPEIITKYFPDLTETQQARFAMLGELYTYWNAMINVVSRKDIDNLYEHHVLHSLALAKVIRFRPGTKILDVGTGGGFPGIPLAILFPDAQFVLEDSIGKKIKVATAVVEKLGLTNVEVLHRNVLEEKRHFDFIVSRAVMNTPDLVRLVKKNVDRKHQQNALPNGLLCLKGGELGDELKAFKHTSEVWNISSFFTEDFFETKKVVYVQL